MSSLKMSDSYLSATDETKRHMLTAILLDNPMAAAFIRALAPVALEALHTKLIPWVASKLSGTKVGGYLSSIGINLDAGSNSNAPLDNTGGDMVMSSGLTSGEFAPFDSISKRALSASIVPEDYASRIPTWAHQRRSALMEFTTKAEIRTNASGNGALIVYPRAVTDTNVVPPPPGVQGVYLEEFETGAFDPDSDDAAGGFSVAGPLAEDADKIAALRVLSTSIFLTTTQTQLTGTGTLEAAMVQQPELAVHSHPSRVDLPNMTLYKKQPVRTPTLNALWYPGFDFQYSYIDPLDQNNKESFWYFLVTGGALNSVIYDVTISITIEYIPTIQQRKFTTIDRAPTAWNTEKALMAIRVARPDIFFATYESRVRLLMQFPEYLSEVQLHRALGYAPQRNSF
jgi:hypothetical protein